MDTLLISGSTRRGSTNSAVLRTVHALAAPELSTEIYGELAALPAFDPDDDHDPLPGPVARLRAAIHDADAHESLAKVLGYVGAHVVDAACLRLPLTRDAVGADGLIGDEAVRATALGTLRALRAARSS